MLTARREREFLVIGVCSIAGGATLVAEALGVRASLTA
jgi:hypothetical protein